jgi:putative chitinase
MDRAKFFAALRRRDSGVFGASLSASQVAGVDAILDEAERRGTKLTHLAYMLATPYHETGRRMQPIRESLNYSVDGLLKTFGRHRISEADARRYGRSGNRPADQRAIANIVYGGEWGAKNLGNTQPGDGWRFRGGGLPQTTGRRNFAKFGIDPERSEDLRTSVRMMFDGMERGLYTTRKLSDFTAYRQMRQVINGMDKADTIAGYAAAFEAALRAAGYSAGAATGKPQDAPKPVPATPKPATPQPAPAKPAGGNTGAKAGGGILVLLAAAAAMFWDKIHAFITGAFS